MSSTQSSNQVDFHMPEVTIDRLVLERIRRYVAQCSTEVSGFGFATIEGAKLHIMDARVVKQDSVGGAHTDINKEALNALMFEWRNRDGILVWWHSHVNMPTLWSVQDSATTKELGKNGMCISIVFNKKNEFRCAVAFRAELPFRKEASVIVIDNVPVVATLSVPKETVDAWDAELAACLPPPTPTSNYLLGGQYGDWDYQSHGTGGVGQSQLDYWSDSEFYDDAVVAAENDVDWHKGCHFSQTKGKWRKSYQQTKKERKEKEVAKSIITKEPDNGVKSCYPASLIQGRRRFALTDEDIVEYDPLADEYVLLCGIKVDAFWYIEKTIEASGDDPALLAVTGMSEDDLADLHEQVTKERKALHAN